jgi:peptidoglycan/LPS O-acetylase OafA/YrhL
MSSTRKPRICSLDKTNLDEDYHHSILISALRSVAALQVLATHLRGEFYPSLATLAEPTLWYQGLAFLTGFGHVAVLIFFLLSGWLVGGSLLNKLARPQILAAYAIDRLTRMWIVLVPAFILTLVLAALGNAIEPDHVSFAPDKEFSAASFLGNLFGMQGMAVPRFGGNFSLWSLANEMWYYALFPLLLLYFCARSLFGRVASLLVSALVASQLLVDITLYFLLWLLGVVFSRIRIELPRPMRWALILVLVAVVVVCRLEGSIGTLIVATFPEDLLISLLFLCLLSSLQFPADRTRPGNRLALLVAKLAPFSFTLYVVHYPILLTIKQIFRSHGVEHLSTHDPRSLIVYGAMFLAIVTFAWLFHLPFEAQTYRVRAFLKRLLLKPLNASAPASASSSGTSAPAGCRTSARGPDAPSRAAGRSVRTRQARTSL